MKLIPLVFISLILQSCCVTLLSEALNNLRKLESYISLYKTEKKSSASLTHLITSFIREGKYTGTSWSIAAGSAPSDLLNYITQKDTEKGTNTIACRKYGEITLPSKEKVDFVHMFAVMNGIEYGNSYTDEYSALVGWGGDTSQLEQDIMKKNGTLDELIAEANKLLGKSGQFGEGDLYSDLDAPILLKKKTDKITFADILEEYYNGEEWKNRVPNFVKITFPTIKDKSELRKTIFNRYNNDGYIPVLECKYGIRVGGNLLGCYSPHAVKSQYKDHQKAAVYAFSDYLKKRM